MNATVSRNAAQAQPQSTRPGHRVPVWLKRGLLGLLVVAIALPLMGATYQAIAVETDKRNYPALGQRVDVGGFSLHIYCQGQHIDGRPTVILEPSLGATSSAWAWIQPEVAKTTRVCAYDRAGLGWSDPSPAPRDAQHIATELHTLLQNAQILGPYVLAGWSYGGLYVRAYANQYPEDVAGLVLLDSSSPEQCTSTPGGQAQCANNARIYSIAPALARLGVMRLMGLVQPASGLPAPHRQALLASFSATKDWDAQSAEFLASVARNTPPLSAESLGAMPLFVLTATEHGTPPDLEQLWQGWQTGFTALSTNSVQQVLPGATHASIILDATDAQASATAILRVIEAARTNQPLTAQD
jgi:pimeloyl-ACP methyl ester carboxylesterase